MDPSEPLLPEGWTKQWSNSWKKNYWFNSRTGKQSWEHPGAADGGGAAEATTPKPPGVEAAASGEKRKAPDSAPTAHPASKVPTESNAGAATTGGASGGCAGTAAARAGNKPASHVKEVAKKPAASAVVGGLASILGSIASSQRAPTAKELETRKKKKEAEEARMVEVRAERDNYKQWVGFQLDSFIEEGREYYEMPPSDSLHRIIAKDEAEERGCVAFSHGEKEEEKRVYVFPDGKGPNEFESRFLKMGGSVPELVERRGRGDTFQEYNTHFSLNDAKLVTKVRVKNAGAAGEDVEDEIHSRKMNHRNVDASQAKEMANQLRQSRQEAASAFLGED